jgi:hypothetical protein
MSSASFAARPLPPPGRLTRTPANPPDQRTSPARRGVGRCGGGGRAAAPRSNSGRTWESLGPSLARREDGREPRSRLPTRSYATATIGFGEGEGGFLHGSEFPEWPVTRQGRVVVDWSRAPERDVRSHVMSSKRSPSKITLGMTKGT